MAILKKDLLSLRKEFKAVGKQMEMLLKTVEKSNKAPKAAAKKAFTRKTVIAKVTQKAPAKKVAVQKKLPRLLRQIRYWESSNDLKKGVMYPH